MVPVCNHVLVHERRDKYVYFVCGPLIRTCVPLMASLKVMMDNCLIHHVSEVMKLKFFLLFATIHYSPDMKFDKVLYSRDHDELMQLS